MDASYFTQLKVVDHSFGVFLHMFFHVVCWLHNLNRCINLLNSFRSHTMVFANYTCTTCFILHMSSLLARLFTMTIWCICLSVHIAICLQHLLGNFTFYLSNYNWLCKKIKSTLLKFFRSNFASYTLILTKCTTFYFKSYFVEWVVM